MKLLESKYNISSITVMVQKEVGLRLASKEGSSDYSAITVSLNYYSNAKVIIDVPKENFLPSPKVDSVVIKIDILDTPKVMVEDEKLFFNLIKAGFSQRRKTINNSLSSGGIPKDVILKTLSELNIDAKKRAEDLSIQDFANISNKIQLFLKGNKND
jgi:16S rRNA (adenine1518-N6/adenine1519-N6)-dimethyltransferase